jgi:hypothetical protein
MLAADQIEKKRKLRQGGLSPANIFTKTPKAVTAGQQEEEVLQSPLTARISIILSCQSNLEIKLLSN